MEPAPEIKQFLHEAAIRGSLDAVYGIGKQYLKTDIQKAISMFELAAEQGNSYLGLDPFEFMILSYMVRRMNGDSECWPSYKTMSKDLGISVSTLEDRIAKLEKRKLISVRKYTGSGKHRNNMYTLWSLETPEIYRDPDAVENEELPLSVA